MTHDERTNCWGKVLGVATCLWFTVKVWQVTDDLLFSFAVSIFGALFFMLALTPVYYLAASLLALIHLPKND